MNRLLKYIALLAILIVSIGVNISTAEASTFFKTRVIQRPGTVTQYQVLYHNTRTLITPTGGANICILNADAQHSLRVSSLAVIESQAEAEWIQTQLLPAAFAIMEQRVPQRPILALTGSSVFAGQNALASVGSPALLNGAAFAVVNGEVTNFGTLTPLTGTTWASVGFSNPMPLRVWFGFQNHPAPNPVRGTMVINTNPVNAVICKWDL